MGDYNVAVLALVVGLALAAPALIAKWLEWRLKSKRP